MEKANRNKLAVTRWLPIVVIIFQCTTPPKLNSDSPSDIIEQSVLWKSSTIFRGTGIAKGSREGERFSAVIDAQRLADTLFRCDVYSGLGTLVASAESDSVMGKITIDGSERLVALSSPLPQVFFGIPFTFGRFARILTGDLNEFGMDIDSAGFTGGLKTIFISNNAENVQITLNVKQSGFEWIRITPDNSGAFALLKKFRDGMATQIHFESPNGDFLSVNYEKVSLTY